jgi:small-conductance mechanosensitive channel
LLAWANQAGQVVALFWFLLRMIKVVESQLRRWTASTDSKWDDVIVVVVVKALKLIVPLIGIILVVPTLDLPMASHQLFKQGASLVLIGAVGFILYQIVQSVEVAVLGQFRIDVRDNLEARKIYTQVKVLKKIATVVIVIFTAATMLMVFDSVRQLGTSILASAGVLGIIVGFAAQRSIATVLAGFQIAMTQPIRLDDVVIVEGEWGRIEEITLTYVVVLIWDQRRLVVPINYFIEKPFQNWTRVSADLLGTVFLYVDYTVPVQALRDELDRLLTGNNLWDGRVKGIQVTDSKERVLELRVLVSAADAPSAFDLRCLVREKLVEFLQRQHPGSLPRMRAELSSTAPVSTAIKP